MNSIPEDSNGNQQPECGDLPTLRGYLIRKDDAERVCLNDIWVAAGKVENQAPKDWRRLPRTKGLMIAAQQQMVGKSPGLIDPAVVSRTGRHGGTYADPRLALDYAEYLSPALALEVKGVFLRYLQADAALADDVLERASPEANEWAGIRALSRAQRRKYTDCLQAHGVSTGRDYAACSDTLYVGLFDRRAAALKASKGLGKSASLRDNLTTDELAYVVAGETLARERIDEEGSDGGEACRLATLRSARNFRRGLELDRADRKGRTPPAANENLKPDNAA